MAGISSTLPNDFILGDRYIIVKQIGQGGFGRTYLAQDTHRYNEKCVLKEFAPLLEGDADLKKAEELFEREAGILYQLKHDRIPQFKALLRTRVNNKKALFLVQEYIKGDTYYDLLKDSGRFSEAEIIDLIKELLPVLEYIHEQNLIHRDISPDNLIYRRWDRKPVLIDFGCVKQAANAISRSQGHLITLIGKKGYAPEEQLRNGSAYPCSDLYSLAATAVVLLTGKSPEQLYDAHRREWQWEREVRVSSTLAKILNKMLAYHPRDRYQSASEIVNVLNSQQDTSVNSFISQIRTLIVAPKNKFLERNESKNRKTRSQPFTRQFTKPINRNLTRIKTRAISVSKEISRQIDKVPYVRQIEPWQWAGIVAAVAIVPGIITFSTIYNIGSIISLSNIKNGVVKTIYVLKNKVNLPAISLGKETRQQQDIYQRVSALNINSGLFFERVDREFYRQYPELKGVALTNSAEHRQYRRQWYQIAEELLHQIERE